MAQVRAKNRHFSLFSPWPGGCILGGMPKLLASLFALLALGGVACSGTDAEPEDPDAVELGGEELLSKSFKVDAIVEDIDLTDASALTAAEIDDFLDHPYPDLGGKASCLASYKSGGKTVGQLFAEKAKTYKINPIFLLAHLQKESSLVSNTKATCSSSKMAAAFGCGCPDGQGCSSQFAGFAGQLECAAKLTRSYLDDLNGGGATVSGWRVNKAKNTLDKRTISPKTKATAVLYTYTPWVGDKNAAGNKAPFGNYLFWKVWQRYTKTLGYAGVSPAPVAVACTSDAKCNGGKAGTGKVCSLEGATKGMCVSGCNDDSDCATGKVCSHATDAGACVASVSDPIKSVGEACDTNVDCNGGVGGTERVCGASSRVCIVGCGTDNDCPQGEVCDRSLPKWACVAELPPAAQGEPMARRSAASMASRGACWPV